MFCMTIVFGSSPVPWSLLFKTPESFDKARTAYNSGPTMTIVDNRFFELTDDYGQYVIIKREDITGVMFEDMQQSRMAHIERGLHQMRTQIEANNMGKSDPMIAAHMRGMGPGVITPSFGPNGAFRQ